MNEVQRDIYDSLTDNGWDPDGLVMGDPETPPTRFAIKRWGEDAFPYTRVGVKPDGSVKVVDHYENDCFLISDW